MMEDKEATPVQTYPKKSYRNVIISVVVALALVGGAFYLQGTRAAENNGQLSLRTFSVQELKEFDGKSNRDCYVAVDGTVYKIDQGRFWQNGQHTSSEGVASCGRDLSEAIAQSPHGKSKLSTLEIVGKLPN